MAQSGLTESIIENEIGCGRFQVLIVMFLYLFIKLSAIANFAFMAYGNYIPGWRCLDNHTLTPSPLNVSLLPFNNYSVLEKRLHYQQELICSDFESCQNVEFNPAASTIVTEWNLVCNRAWIGSLITSLQMVGGLGGSLITGYIADGFGRKKAVYGSLLIVTVLNFVSIFSTSWELFAGFRFFIGFVGKFFDNLNYLYPAEFLTKKWRGPMAGIPGWGLMGVVFGVVLMLLQDWRHIHIAMGVMGLISFIPVLWVPESLRWLEVKNRRKEFKRVSEKMARMNKNILVERDAYDFNPQEKSLSISIQTDTKKHTIFDLFHTDYRWITIYISLSWLFMANIWCAIGFGIKALSGNFYINFILMYAVLTPFAIFPFFGPNLLGRRQCSMAAISLAAICLLFATLFELFAEGNLKTIGILVLVMMSQVGADTTFCVQQVHVGEIYPTVVRAIGMNWAAMMAGVGSIFAPFIVPKDSESAYIFYLVTGILGLVCCGLFSRLPETKGKPLAETFETTNHI